MTKIQAFCALLLATLMLTAGFVWLFGPFGLIGGGLAVALLTLFTDEADNDEREDDDG